MVEKLNRFRYFRLVIMAKMSGAIGWEYFFWVITLFCNSFFESLWLLKTVFSNGWFDGGFGRWLVGLIVGLLILPPTYFFESVLDVIADLSLRLFNTPC